MSSTPSPVRDPGDFTRYVTFALTRSASGVLTLRFLTDGRPHALTKPIPASAHSEYTLLADVEIASDTTVFTDMPRLAFGIAPADGMFGVRDEVLGLSRARHLVRTQGSFTAHQALEWG